jgi:hypothetical protein
MINMVAVGGSPPAHAASIRVSAQSNQTGFSLKVLVHTEEVYGYAAEARERG